MLRVKDRVETALREVPLPADVPGQLFTTTLPDIIDYPEGAVRSVGANTLVVPLARAELRRRLPHVAARLEMCRTLDIVQLAPPAGGHVDSSCLIEVAQDVVVRTLLGDSSVIAWTAPSVRPWLLCVLALIGLGIPVDQATTQIGALHPISDARGRA